MFDYFALLPWLWIPCSISFLCHNLDHQDLLIKKVSTAENRMTEVAVIEGNFGRVVYIVTGADVSTQIDANLSPGCLLL